MTTKSLNKTKTNHVASSSDGPPEPQIKASFSTYISETQTIESCSSWSTSTTTNATNSLSNETTRTPISVAASSQFDDTTSASSSSLPRTAAAATTSTSSNKKKNPMNLTIQTMTNGVETSSLCNSLESPPLSTPASFASSTPSILCDNSATATFQREKIILDQCWDRILLRQFESKQKSPSLYGRDNVHTRLHQLVVLSGPTQSGKTLLCQSLSSFSSSGNGEGEAQQDTNHHRILLHGAPAATSQYYCSMEPLRVFSNMMKQLNGYFFGGGGDNDHDNKEIADLQVLSSTSFGSDQQSKSHQSYCSHHQHSHDPLLLALPTQFSQKEQTILVRTFPSLQAFFPKASPKQTAEPTPDTWTRKSPTVAGSYQYQFHSCFKRFLDILASSLPLILVVDDLQGLDLASLELLDFLLAAQPGLDDADCDKKKNSNSILFVLCYTTSSTATTTTTSSLVLSQEEEQQQKQRQNKSYYYSHNNGLNSKDTSGSMPQKNDILATLSYCHELGIKRLPHYDFELTEIVMSTSSLKLSTTPSNDSTIAAISPTIQEHHSSSSLQLLLMSLSPVDLQVAKLAACLGMDPIPLDLLEIAYDAVLANQGGMTPKRSKMAPNAHSLFDHLARLIGQGILEWKPMQMAMVWTSSQLIRETVSLVTMEEDTESLFRVMADGLVDALSEQQKEYWIYLIADLHNTAGVVVEKEIKTANLAKLNQQAALRAIHSGSLLAAGHYLSQAIRALKQAASAKKHHHQALEHSLHRLWMQVSAYTNNDVGLRVASSHLLVEDKQGFLEKLMIHQTQFSGLLSSCSINPNATHIAQQGANRCFQLLASDLAMKFPTKDLVQGVTVTKGLMKLKSQSKSKASVTPNSRALLKIPIMDKPIQFAAMKLLETCANFCYMAGDVRFPLVVLKSVELFQKYGLSIYAPMVHALVGVLMVIALDDSKAGIAYANYSLTLWTRAFDTSAVQKALEAQTICLSHFVVLPWANRFDDLLTPLRRAYELAMQGGDIDIAAQAISNYAVLAFLSGRELSVLNKELCYYVNQLRRFNRIKWEATCQIWWYVVRRLLPADRSLSVAPGAMNEEEIMTYVLQTKDEDVLCNFHGANAILYTLQGNHQMAADNAVENSDHAFKTLKGHPLLMVLPFYMGISLCEVAQKSGNDNYKKHAKKMLSITKEYNKKGNPNTAHHFTALEAETQLLGEGRQHLATARKKYQEAISSATKAELFQDAALLHQRLGTFYLEHMDNMEDSKQHNLQSSTFVRQWGAKECVRL